MLRVTIEVLPGGSEARKQRVAKIDVIRSNHGPADVGDYAIRAILRGHYLRGDVRGFHRRRGAAALALEALRALVFGDHDAPTYRIVEDGQAIECLRCGRISWHPEDVAQKYCGHCHRFHDEPSAAERQP